MEKAKQISLLKMDWHDLMLNFREGKGKSMDLPLHKNAACNLEQVLAATPHKTPTVRPPASYHENSSG